jgi:sugar transferase EpsL
MIQVRNLGNELNAIFRYLKSLFANRVFNAIEMISQSMNHLWTKHILDLIGATILLVLLLPVMLIVSCFIFVTMGRPIIFKQDRLGRNNKPFVIYKFRTMSPGSGILQNIEPDEVRVTRLGRLLRSTSLDELPELWNVLKGEMSLVGPRPLLVDYLPLYSTGQKVRHNVRPGITGWVQVRGRNSLSWDEKFELDSWYVENRTMWLDFKILVLTIFIVVKRDGVYAPEGATMPRFIGTKNVEKD